MSALRKRCDSKKNVYDCCLLPRRPKDLSGHDTLQTVCDFWACAVTANGGVPPLCMSHDNHALQVQLTEIFLGIRPIPQMPFLCQCTKAPKLPIPGWPYTTLMFGETWPVFGCNDPPHCQKNVVCAMRSAKRLLRTSDLRVVLGHLRLKDLPTSAYQGKDPQSDKDAAWVLNSRLISSSHSGVFH